MTARVQRGRCPNGVRYRNKGAVRGAIDATRFKFEQKHGRLCAPLYPYRCDSCRGWHMTRNLRPDQEAM